MQQQHQHLNLVLDVLQSLLRIGLLCPDFHWEPKCPRKTQDSGNCRRIELLF